MPPGWAIKERRKPGDGA